MSICTEIYLDRSGRRSRDITEGHGSMSTTDLGVKSLGNNTITHQGQHVKIGTDETKMKGAKRDHRIKAGSEDHHHLDQEIP